MTKRNSKTRREARKMAAIARTHPEVKLSEVQAFLRRPKHRGVTKSATNNRPKKRKRGHR